MRRLACSSLAAAVLACGSVTQPPVTQADVGGAYDPSYKPTSACATKLTLLPVPVLIYGPTGDAQGGVTVGYANPPCDEPGFYNPTDYTGIATIWAEAGPRQIGASIGVMQGTADVVVAAGMTRTTVHLQQCVSTCFSWDQNGVHPPWNHF